MYLNIPSTNFVCVDYPGVVQNDEKMLKTLGGNETVTKTFNDSSKRLELKFRPTDVYCKAACADQHATTCLLLRVRRKRETPPAVDENKDGTAKVDDDSKLKASELEGEILGIVETEYRFTSLCDFQYLSMTKEGDEYRSLESELTIDRLQTSSWFHEPAQLHLPPSIFSRYDHPGSYCFKDPPQPRPGTGAAAAADIDPKFIGIGRQKRHNYTRVFNHADPVVPCEPHSEVIERLNNRLARTDLMERIKEKFNTQPIWSRNALHCQTPEVSDDDLKYILPAVAYYCLTGPFRGMWVKLGYEMRKDPASKIYQCLDFRFPRVKNMIQAKRAVLSYKMPNTVTKAHPQAATIKYELLENAEGSSSNPDAATKTGPESLEAKYIFRPEVVPAYRQMFYQLCHIEEPQVQQLIHTNDGLEMSCSEQDGWCLPDTIDKCRKILTGHMLKLLGIENSAESSGRRKGRASNTTSAASREKPSTSASAVAESSRSVNTNELSNDDTAGEADD